MVSPLVDAASLPRYGFPDTDSIRCGRLWLGSADAIAWYWSERLSYRTGEASAAAPHGFCSAIAPPSCDEPEPTFVAHAPLLSLSARLHGIEAHPDTTALLASVRVPRVEDLVTEDLASLRGSVSDEEQLPPTPDAERACIAMARILGPVLNYDQTIKVAVFPSEAGGLVMVAHSMELRRRADLEINPAGMPCRIDSVDENDCLQTQELTGDCTDELVEAALWVVGANRDN